VCKKGNQCVYLVDWFNVPSSFWYRSGQRIVKEYFTNLWKDLSAPAPFGEVGKKYKQKNDDFIQGGDIGLWALKHQILQCQYSAMGRHKTIRG
jgi:hypothetical protein